MTDLSKPHYDLILARDAALRRAEVAESDAAALREALKSAYITLRAWHDRAHSRNRPPDLNCTGCAIWPVIADLAAALNFDPLAQRDPPQRYEARDAQ